MVMKKCKVCSVEKKIHLFQLRKDTGKYHSTCIKCRTEQNRITRAKKRVHVFIERPKTKAWEKADSKIYISPSAKKLLKPIVYVLCKYCRCEINKNNTPRSLLNKSYCSEWCWEIDNPPKIKKVCSCGNSIAPHYYKSGKKKGQSASLYPKFCEECIKVGKHKWRGGNKKHETIRNTKRVIDKGTDN